jgi:putative DNA primase/helicase
MPDGTTPPGAGFTVEDVDAGRVARDTELARLAALDPIDYDQQREDAAKVLGCRVSTLDDQVRERRPMPEAGTGRGVSLPAVDPWPEPITGGAVLDALAAAVRRHVILRPAAADAVALWIAHTWVADRFQHTPRLAITSPAKRCGKSTLLDVLHMTCRRPVKADNISASGVFRTVEALRPLTLLLDEADAFLAENEELRGVLNSGFERSGEVIRVVEVKGEWQPIRFATFAPLALAGIGTLPGTLEDRAVPIALQRKGAGEDAVKLRAPGARGDLADIARKLARWAGERGKLLTAPPPIPEALGDREGDIAVPLLAVADDAGGAWPARARAALLDLFGRRTAAGGNMEAGGLLLADLRALFLGTSATRMLSADIVARLATMEERPWPEWKQGKPMTAPQLARALAPFGVRPGTVRVGAGTAKGYHKEAFEDAWMRYLPPEDTLSGQEGGSEPSHRHSPANTGGLADSRSVTPTNHVPERNRPRSPPNGHCDGVTVPNPPDGRKGVGGYL